MEPQVTPESILLPSDDIVAREIEGELIIVPLVAGIGDAEEELYTLSDTGRAIWKLLDGSRSLRAVADHLSAVYEAAEGAIERDVLGLATELVKRRMLIEAGSGPAK
jgi:hypothetical protein